MQMKRLKGDVLTMQGKAGYGIISDIRKVYPKNEKISL